jgi:predicted enzyme related to lactoylglutathione lyase
MQMATQDQTTTTTLNLNSIMVGTSQVKALAAFYEKVFGRPADMADEPYYGWQVGSTFLMVGEHSEIHGQSKEPARMMLNFETGEVQKEFERLKQAGATVVKEPYSMDGSGWIATLSDPDGNFLQLMTPFE